MPRGFSRVQRIAASIQTNLAEILLRDSEDPRFRLITITGVNLARDLSFAKVYVSILEEEKSKEIIAALNRAAKFFRFTLAHKIDLRVVPELRFYYDDSTVRGYHISSLLNATQKKPTKAKKNKR